MKTTGKIAIAGVAVAALATVSGVVMVGKNYYEDHFGSLRLLPATKSMCAEFTDTIGLYPGNSVTLLGMQIGKVDSIDPEGDHMLVHFSVDADQDFPADVWAVTMASSVVTDRRIEMTKPYVDGPKFDTATCVRLDHTKTPKGISEAFNAANTIATDLLGADTGDPDKDKANANILGDTLAGTAKGLDGTGPLTNNLIKQLAAMYPDPQKSDATMRTLIDNLDQLTQMFATNWGDLQAVLDNINETTKLFGGFSNELTQMVGIATDVLPVVLRNAEKYGPRATALLDHLVPIVHVILARAGDLKDILEQIPAVMTSLGGLYDADSRAGRLIYHPPQFEVATASATEICALINKYVPSCTANFHKGDVIDVGLLQLVLGSAGWR